MEIATGSLTSKSVWKLCLPTQSSMEVLLSKASVFSQLKDTKNAIKYFKGAIIEAAPEDRDEIYLDLAMEYQNNDEYQLAINVLIEAVNANKSNEGAIYELAYLSVYCLIRAPLRAHV